MSETERVIDSIHTSCKDCVFAIYEDQTQTGCSMSMIEKYKAKNCEIIEAYDDDKEFYIINKRKCINHRKESWFKQFENSDNSLEYRIEKTNASNKINYILLIDLKLFTVEKLHQTFFQKRLSHMYYLNLFHENRHLAFPLIHQNYYRENPEQNYPYKQHRGLDLQCILLGESQ